MDNKTLILSIRNCIKQKGLVQGYVAEKAGFSYQQFSDMLNGRKLLLAEYIPRIANALGVTANEIYYGANENKAG